MKYKQAVKCKLLNHNFQLKFAQEKYNEIECKLHQQFQSLQIQSNNIHKILNKTKDSETSQNIISKIKQQEKRMIQFCKQLKNQVTHALLVKQTLLEDQAQRRQIIRQYQERICQMDFNRYTKEVDISVDHIGKLVIQKPYYSKVREFSRIKLCQQNIDIFIRKINKLNRQIDISQKTENTFQINQALCSNKLAEIYSQTQDYPKKEKSQSTIPGSSLQVSNHFHIQHNPQSLQSSYLADTKKQKLLILSSEQKMYKKIYKNIFNKIDPQIFRMLGLIQKQKERQNILELQFKKLHKEYTQLQNKRMVLVSQYKKNGQIHQKDRRI